MSYIEKILSSLLELRNINIYIIFYTVYILLIITGCRDRYEVKSVKINQNLMIVDTIPASALPTLYISIEESERDSINNNQNYKADADAILLNTTGDTIYEGFITIKTRGNGNFYSRGWKPPYTIQIPYVQQWLNLDRGTKYILVSNSHGGRACLTNALALDIARGIGNPAPKYAYIRLCINREYCGLYQMTNKVELKSLGIRSLVKYNKDYNPCAQNDYPAFNVGSIGECTHRKGVLLDEEPDDISGGYMLDFGAGIDFGNGPNDFQYKKHPSGFCTINGSLIKIREPKYASYEEVDYIKKRFDEFLEAVMDNTGYNRVTGKHYSEYIDVESFVRYYLVQELMMNYDAGINSFPIYKNSDEIDSLLYAGHIWDMDGCMYVCMYGKDELMACAGYNKSGVQQNIFYWLMRHKEFENMARTIYLEELYPYVERLMLNGYLDSLYNLLADEIKYNNIRYVYDKREFSETLNEVRDFIYHRLEFLYWLWTSPKVDMVKVDIVNVNYDSDMRVVNRAVTIFSDKKNGISLPQFPVTYNKDPEVSYRFADTHHMVAKDTTFFSNQKVVMNWQSPSKVKIQIRRIKKKIKKIL